MKNDLKEGWDEMKIKNKTLEELFRPLNNERGFLVEALAAGLFLGTGYLLFQACMQLKRESTFREFDCEHKCKLPEIVAECEHGGKMIGNKIKSLDERLGPDWEGKLLLEEGKAKNSYLKSFAVLKRDDNLIADFYFYDNSYRVKWKTYIGQKRLRMLTEKLYPDKKATALMETLTYNYRGRKEISPLKKILLKDALQTDEKIFSLGVGNKEHSLGWQKSEYGLYSIEFSSGKKNMEILEAMLKATMPKRDWEQIIGYLDRLLKNYPD